ncbi:hypothetical protein [Paenisporosarcina sp. HGH0030]|nr:hypothetical protein [Paenisporosarcina sp. HGH0030]
MFFRISTGDIKDSRVGIEDSSCDIYISIGDIWAYRWNQGFAGGYRGFVV